MVDLDQSDDISVTFVAVKESQSGDNQHLAISTQ